MRDRLPGLMASLWQRGAAFAAFVACVHPARSLAQRVDDNVIANANDAFGQSVGNERVGLYGVDDVRGFSPVDAGNARIEGLYFAPVDRLPNRLARGNRARVGIAAQGYPFPAPTGIVDYELSASGTSDQFTLGFERAQFGSLLASLDSQFAVAPDVRAYIGGTVRRQNRHEGGNFKSWIGSGGLGWRPLRNHIIARLSTSRLQASRHRCETGPSRPALQGPTHCPRY